MTTPKELQPLQEAVWNGSLPLQIRLSPSDCRIYDQADPYLIQHHRLSYLPLLLPRLHAFFSPFLINPDVPPNEGWFTFEDVPLKWHYPLGLLYDLFSGAAPSSQGPPPPQSKTKIKPTPSPQPPSPSSSSETAAAAADPLPWRLVLHFTDWPDEHLVRLDGDGKVLHDAYINSVKEADFLRNGTAKGIMSLSKEDSTRLWRAVQEHHLPTFSPIASKLLHAQGAPLRHIPLRIYLPSSPSSSTSSLSHLKIVQSLVTPTVVSSGSNNNREPQTLGMALNTLLPSLFPSKRTPILAKPVLHGAVVPLRAGVEEVLRAGAFLDGWLHLGIVMMG
ncbi:autophagy protein 5 [Loxospora ochrophaea]|nr:autophagy protein 5 [Loxospora ochrophaea]